MAEQKKPNYRPGLVSYIVPAFNAQDHIKSTLQSCWLQDYRPIEVVIVNDGSTDNTEEVVVNFANQYACDDFFVIYQKQENLGISAARNKGLLVASGEYIGFLDSDDLLPKQRTKLLLSGMLEYCADLVFGVAQPFRTDNEAIPLMGSAIGEVCYRPESHLPLIKCYPSIGLYLVRRNFLRKVGQFDARLRQCDECEYMFRIRCESPIMYRCDEIVFLYRQRPGSASKSGDPERNNFRFLSHKLIADNLSLQPGRDSISRNRLYHYFVKDGLNYLRYKKAGLAKEALRRSIDFAPVGNKFPLACLANMITWPGGVYFLSMMLRIRDTIKLFHARK